METTNNQDNQPTISTAACPLISYDVRKCGNTERQAEFAIEQIFNGRIVKVVDHTNLQKLSEALLDRIIQKLVATYKLHICEIEINRKKLTIALKNPSKSISQITSVTKLIKLLAAKGGKIVNTSSLSVEEIAQARASGRMVVTSDSLEFCWIPEIKQFPSNEEEVAEFDRYYPLPVELPEDVEKRIARWVMLNGLSK